MKSAISFFGILWFLVVNLHAQSVFVPTNLAHTETKDEWYIDAIALNAKEIILLGANLQAASKSQELVLQKTNLAGEIIKENKLPLSTDSVFRFCNLFYRKGAIEVIGYAGKLRELVNAQQYHNVLYRYLFDTALNLIRVEKTAIPIAIDFSIMYMRCKLNQNINLYGSMQLFMAPDQVPMNPYGNFFFILDTLNMFEESNLDSIQIEFYDLMGFEMHQISQKNYIGVVGTHFDSFYEYHKFKIFNSKLQFTEPLMPSMDLFNGPFSGVGPFFNLFEINNDTENFITAGVGADFQFGEQTFFVSKSKIDSVNPNFPNVHATITSKVCFFKRNYHGPRTSTIVPAYFQCLDRNVHGDYVFAGMLNHRMDERTQSSDLVADTLSFAFIDYDLNLKFERSFFNNEQITLHKVMFMPDGSILAIGFTRDYIKNPNNLSRDYFALKLNKNGEPVNGFINHEKQNAEVLVYPNPAKEFTRVQTGFLVDQFILYNAQGQMVQKDFPNKNNFIIDMRSLPDGAYYIHIFNQNGDYTVKKLMH